MARTPIQDFAKREGVTTRFIYKEIELGRLTLTKVGSRSFIDDEDAEAWRALAMRVTKVTGAQVATQIIEKQILQLGQKVARGRIDRAHVVNRLTEVIHKSGLGRFEPSAATTV
jgi:hypothetical protein